MKFPGQIFLALVTEIIFYDSNMAKVSVVMSPGYLMP